MPRNALNTPHQTWEDWLGIALGVAIGLSPWIINQTDSSTAVLNAALVGAAITFIASYELVSLRRWEEFAIAALGLWLVISPFALSFVGVRPLLNIHLFLGAAAFLLGSVQLWQDWQLTDEELSTHGR